MPQYRYSPLSQKPNTIRLLLLLPSKDEPEHLRCELFEYTIQEAEKTSHPYEALSYVWGSGDKPHSIIIDNQKLAVTENLYKALLHLQDRKIPRPIWVDALCINQADEKEKELQIQFMAAIYAKASRVIVWLGEAQDDSDRALDSIRTACEKSAIPSDTEPFEQAVTQLLKRPWFRRIWVRKQSSILSVGVIKYCSRSYKK
jgi:heterokaryon incompatibility protein (HET)